MPPSKAAVYHAGLMISWQKRVEMFEAILVGVLLTNEGKAVEKQWAAFVSMDDCKAIAKVLTNDMKRSQGDPVVFRCDGPRQAKVN